MKTIQKYKISILIAFLGVSMVILFGLPPRPSMVGVVMGAIISLIGGGLIIHYMNKYSEEIAQKNTDRVEEFVKERTGIKIPPPPWMKEKP